MKEISFTILGRIPSKKNSKMVTKKRIPISSAAYRKWEKNALIQMSNNEVEKYSSICESILIKVYFPDLGVADLTNKADSVMDTIVKYGVLKDDNWKYTGDVVLSAGVDPENPRVDVYMTEVEDIRVIEDYYRLKGWLYREAAIAHESIHEVLIKKSKFDYHIRKHKYTPEGIRQKVIYELLSEYREGIMDGDKELVYEGENE